MRAGAGLLVAGLLAAGTACGKKGPPLPPLVRIPAAPADLSASRRGATVDLQFTIPGANTDGSTPADLSRVDLYAVDGPGTLAPEDIIKRGVRVASVKVNPPPDPDEPEGGTPAPDQKGKPKRPGTTPAAETLDQGEIARVSESIDGIREDDPTALRLYAAVGISERGRRGAMSHARASLVPPPAAPVQPEVTYDEKNIVVTWAAAAAEHDKPLGFRVYAPGSAGEPNTILSEKPLEAPRFEDPRIEWGRERCYVVRAVETSGDLMVESEPSPPACVTLRDTFPPAAPAGLATVGVEGVIDLFWESNPEPDVAGYHVFRAVAPDTQLAQVTSSLLATPGFRDSVPRGSRVSYAVQAIDSAGNPSRLSATVEETAR